VPVGMGLVQGVEDITPDVAGDTSAKSDPSLVVSGRETGGGVDVQEDLDWSHIQLECWVDR
jgi:hypothetical protein